MKQKVIRDPIYDYISIDGADLWLLDLLDAPELQRLRYIHQLGVSYLVYPGASHTRFEHTLGVLHLMHFALDCLKKIGCPIDGQTRKCLLAAAVIHDIGHGPFSHLLEKHFGGDHEEWSCKIAESKDTVVNRVLRGQGIVATTVSLIRKTEWSQPQWMKSLISSQLDVDRIDYLLRDSYHTGVGYGEFDYYRLLHTMNLEASPKEEGQIRPAKHFSWPAKSKYAIEEYVLARFYMYQAVYFHKCTRGYEKLLDAVWRRAKELVAHGTKIPLLPQVRPFLLMSKPASVQDYLRLNEYHVLAQISEWSNNRDKVLADLCGRFLYRRGFKCIEVQERLEGLEGHDRLEDAIGHLKRRGKRATEKAEPRYYLLEDRGGVLPYKPYHWAEKEEQQPIFLDGLKEITKELVRLKAVTAEEGRFVRYYCPEEHRKDMEKLLRV